MTITDTTVREAGQDFIRDIIRADLAAGRHKSVITRFPPEPNGYLHIGHAKSICLNFGMAEEFGGHCNLRFDDTNPTKEEQEYIDAIMRDVRWLGFDWGEHLYHASDYFEQLYAWAEHLIRAGKAYVDDQTQEEMRLTRGTLTEAGTESPYRNRSVEENLDLFRRMRAGEFPNGARVLRAKIDMGSGNINLRDPVLYRILHAAHPRTGRAGASTRATISPTASPMPSRASRIRSVRSNSRIIGRSTIGCLENLPVPSRPHQYEFARLNLTYTVLSKRVLTEMVRGGHVGRLGRSAHADARRPAPARRAAGGDSRFHQAHRRRQGEQRRRRRHVRILHPRASEQDRAAPHGGVAAAESRDRELSGRAERRGRGDQSSRGSRARARAASASAASSSSSATTFWRIRRRSSSACRRAPKCACAMPISSPAAKW